MQGSFTKEELLSKIAGVFYKGGIVKQDGLDFETIISPVNSQICRIFIDNLLLILGQIFFHQKNHISSSVENSNAFH